MDPFDEVQDENQKVIIDVGSYETKTGFGGDDCPRSVFRSVIGFPRHIGGDFSYWGLDNSCVGDSAWSKRGILQLKFPFGGDGEKDFDVLEILWSNTFRDLRIASKEYQVVSIDHPFTTKREREREAEIFFERFNCPGLFVADQAILALYGQGIMTGLSLHSGHQQTCAVAVYEGQPISHSRLKSSINGANLDHYFFNLLMERGYSFTGSSEVINLVRDIKERSCVVALDFEKDVRRAKETSELDLPYELPDGQFISTSIERIRGSEVLFDPLSMDLQGLGFHQLVNQSIQNCDVELRSELYRNIILTGGNVKFDGIEERMKKELLSLEPNYEGNIKVTKPDYCKYSSWIGGSILSSLDSFHSTILSKREYEESGNSVIHARFPSAE